MQRRGKDLFMGDSWMGLRVKFVGVFLPFFFFFPKFLDCEKLTDSCLLFYLFIFLFILSFNYINSLIVNCCCLF